MLERIREGSQSFTAKAILVLIILTFALAGVGGYITSGTEDAVAEVNGEEILKVLMTEPMKMSGAAYKSSSAICFPLSLQTPTT